MFWQKIQREQQQCSVYSLQATTMSMTSVKYSLAVCVCGGGGGGGQKLIQSYLLSAMFLTKSLA